MKTYTDRVDGFQIRDVCYLCDPPKDAPIQYDVVKWVQEKEPHFGTVLHRDENGKWYSTEEWCEEYCYTVGTLEWDAHEPWFVFKSCGLRWLEAKPSEAVIDMVLQFCEEKEKELDRE